MHGAGKRALESISVTQDFRIGFSISVEPVHLQRYPVSGFDCQLLWIKYFR